MNWIKMSAFSHKRNLVNCKHHKYRILMSLELNWKFIDLATKTLIVSIVKVNSILFNIYLIIYQKYTKIFKEGNKLCCWLQKHLYSKLFARTIAEEIYYHLLNKLAVNEFLLNCLNCWIDFKEVGGSALIYRICFESNFRF